MSLSRIFAVALPLVILPAAVFAQENPTLPAAQPLYVGDKTPVTKDMMSALVKEVLVNEPEIIMQAVQTLREKQRAEAEKKTHEAIIANKAALYDSPDSPVIGNSKDADVTIVEFFDYHCGYCKHILPVIAQIVKEDPKVRVVFKEFPILSEDSVKAARAAIAVHRLNKDKYFDFHTELMKHQGKFEEKNLTDMAKKVGVDGEAMLKEMAKQEVTDALDKSRTQGEAIGVTGTPALILNDHFLPGAVDIDDLKAMIANVRAGKKPDFKEEKPEAKKEEKKE